MREVEPVTCAICNEPFSPSDATTYLVAENVLMHHACGQHQARCRHMLRDGEAPTFGVSVERQQHGTA